jgi:hypothetical protein
VAEPLRVRALRGLFIGAVAATLLAVAGAFGTHQVGLWPRLGYWFAVILPGSLLGLFVVGSVRAWGGLARWRWLEAAAAALLIALPLTFVVVVASAITFGYDRIDVPTVRGFFSVVLMVSLVMTGINYATAPRVLVVPVPPTGEPVPVETPLAVPAPGAMPAAFADRLPPRLQAGRLIALAAEDHYLRVYTDLGNDLVLMRMADAAALLAEVDGARVHRSWWVARAAVEAVERAGERIMLRLPGGLVAPVSRAQKAELAARGWL